MVKIEIGPSEDGGIRATLTGKIDEKFDGNQILAQARPGQRVTLRLDGVRSISSLGVRALEHFMQKLGNREVVLEDISAAVANQVTMIPNLLGRATVKSAKLPFVCPSCGVEEARSVPYVKDAATTHAPKCSACGAKMDFDGFSEEYLPHA
jgi:anti-anti-sigma regulatory factor